MDEVDLRRDAEGNQGRGLLIDRPASTRTKLDPFIAADATPEYLEGLKRTIAKSGLTANMGALRSRHDIPIEDTIKSLRKEIDNAAFLGLK